MLDLKGKTFSFVNLHSTSGYQYPNALMREQRIIPKTFFGKVYILGSHPRVTDAIVSGRIDSSAGSKLGTGSTLSICLPVH